MSSTPNGPLTAKAWLTVAGFLLFPVALYFLTVPAFEAIGNNRGIFGILIASFAGWLWAKKRPGSICAIVSGVCLAISAGIALQLFALCVFGALPIDQKDLMVERFESRLDRAFFYLKNTVQVGLFSGVALIFLLSMLNYSLKSSKALQAYLSVTKKCSQATFILGVATSLTVGAHYSYKRGLDERYAAMVRRFDTFAERECRLRIKHGLIEAMRPRETNDVTWVKTIADTIRTASINLSRRYTNAPYYRSRDFIREVVATQLQDYVHGAAKRVTAEPPSPSFVALKQWPASYEAWQDQKRIVSQAAADAAAIADKPGALETLKLAVAALVPEVPSVLVNYILADVVDEATEQIFKRFGEGVTRSYEKQVTSVVDALQRLPNRVTQRKIGPAFSFRSEFLKKSEQSDLEAPTAEAIENEFVRRESVKEEARIQAIKRQHEIERQKYVRKTGRRGR